MIQDIAPHRLDNSFKAAEPRPNSMVFIFQGQKPLMIKSETTVTIPNMEQLPGGFEKYKEKAIYLFSVDEAPIFLIAQEDFEEEIPQGMEYDMLKELYRAEERWIPLAGATANHLNHWYLEHRFCGCCGAVSDFSKTERAKVCPVCGNIQYPRISPVIMAAVVDGDRILVTRYAGRPYKGLALNAGFVEIGENLEAALKREVMEEVGLQVGKLEYFGSQPWGFSDSVISGFFAHLEGSDQVKLDRNELAEAVWMKREELPPQDTSVSITAAMIEAFRLGK